MAWWCWVVLVVVGGGRRGGGVAGVVGGVGGGAGVGIGGGGSAWITSKKFLSSITPAPRLVPSVQIVNLIFSAFVMRYELAETAGSAMKFVMRKKLAVWIRVLGS